MTNINLSHSNILKLTVFPYVTTLKVGAKAVFAVCIVRSEALLRGPRAGGRAASLVS